MNEWVRTGLHAVALTVLLATMWLFAGRLQAVLAQRDVLDSLAFTGRVPRLSLQRVEPRTFQASSSRFALDGAFVAGTSVGGDPANLEIDFEPTTLDADPLWQAISDQQTLFRDPGLDRDALEYATVLARNCVVEPSARSARDFIGRATGTGVIATWSEVAQTYPDLNAFRAASLDESYQIGGVAVVQSAPACGDQLYVVQQYATIE